MPIVIEELITGYSQYGQPLTSTMIYHRIFALISTSIVIGSIIAGIVVAIHFIIKKHKRRKQGRGK